MKKELEALKNNKMQYDPILMGLICLFLTIFIKLLPDHIWMLVYSNQFYVSIFNIVRQNASSFVIFVKHRIQLVELLVAASDGGYS